MFSWLYNNILYRPLFNILVSIYNIFPLKDIGWAIILITVLIRAILYPLSRSSIQSQKKLQTLKPKIDELKNKYKDDQEAFGRASMELYRREKINPAASCLPLLIQFPILIAVYGVFRVGLTSNNFDLLYSFVQNPGTINSLFLGLIDLAKPNTVLAILAGVGQFVQSRMVLNLNKKKGDPAPKSGNNIADAMSKQMVYVMPFFTFFIGLSLPSGLALYWIISILFTILQQYLVFVKKEKQPAKVE